MHLLIPFAAPVPEFGDAPLKGLRLPSLAAWAAAAGAPQRDAGDPLSLTPPHERVLAHSLGLGGGDGALPWAAHWLRRDGVEPGDLAWGMLTPVHWVVGTEGVTVADPHLLALDEGASRALFETVRDLFEGDGRVLVWGAPLRWYMAHEALAELRTASIDRAVGRNVDHWQGLDEGAAWWRRLQSEVQMRLHEAPLNAEREARGELPVNSLWLSGCGVASPKSAPRPDAVMPQVDDRLRGPALAGDLDGWRQAWQALDAGPLRDLDERRQRGQTVRLTLCGEGDALSWQPTRSSWWQRLRARWQGADATAVLAAL